MLKVLSAYALSYCGGVGLAAIISDGIKKKNPLTIAVGITLIPFSLLGAGYAGRSAGEALFDELTEKERTKKWQLE